MASTKRFIGRACELDELLSLKELPHSSLCVIKGRRRIGKSRLLGEFATYFPNAYIFSGLPPEGKVTAQDQRDEFARQLMTQLGLRGIKTDNWGDLFWHLADRVTDTPTLIILDEITWMGDKDSTFLPKLKNAWDLYFSKHEKLILALSGSLSAWIEDNILSSTGYLGRVSLEMDLEELPLNNCVEFWYDYAHKVSAFQKLKVLAVTGGIPRYLENINPKQSAEDNIKRLCFTRNSILSKEFKKVFSDLYNKKSPIYGSIVRILADGISDQATINSKLGYKRSGKLSTYLDNLVKSGFVSRDFTWKIINGKYSKLSKYRLKDNYSRFYLKYIEPNLVSIQQGNYKDISMNDLPNWSGIMSLQIENLVLSNRDMIKKALNINPSDIVCDNPFFQRQTTKTQGCQVDYMIQTKYNTLYICEVKYSKNEIRSNVIDELKEKIQRLSLPKHFSYRCVLIHANSVSTSVAECGFFDYILDLTEIIAAQ